jgi:hypothetical protein
LFFEVLGHRITLSALASTLGGIFPFSIPDRRPGQALDFRFLDFPVIG